ncbi:MAG TPA: hypothetical protein VFB62_08000 [Polyangiaceae bacterium]|jgi:hypothetical protein|nr:hypothetical protein [Polyangiaceae bacterium]
MGSAKSDPPQSASVWRDISRMEAELIDPEEQATTAYNRPQLLEMLRRARQKQAEQEAPEIDVAEVDTKPAEKRDEEEVTAPASLPSQHRPSSAPPSIRRSESGTAWLLIIFLAVLLAMVAVMFL